MQAVNVSWLVHQGFYEIIQNYSLWNDGQAVTIKYVYLVDWWLNFDLDLALPSPIETCVEISHAQMNYT